LRRRRLRDLRWFGENICEKIRISSKRRPNNNRETALSISITEAKKARAALTR